MNLKLTPFENLAYLTPSEKGLGGRLKQRPDDFLVEEIPSSQPGGSGPWLHLLVEKTSQTTAQAAALLAEYFQVSPQAVTFAGLKDKKARTRQAFRLENADLDKADTFDHPALRILDADRAEAPLKPGDLLGNRFQIRVRDVCGTAAPLARRLLAGPLKNGVPNYFGPQRMGYRGDNPDMGLALLREDPQGFLKLFLGDARSTDRKKLRRARKFFDQGDLLRARKAWPPAHATEQQVLEKLIAGIPPHEAIQTMPRTQLSVLKISVASAVFNETLNACVQNGTFATAANSTPSSSNHAMATGPVWGPGMPESTGEFEKRVIDAVHPELRPLLTRPAAPPGARRPLVLDIEEPALAGGSDEYGPYLELRFRLAKGAYATSVLREIMKTPALGT